MSTHTLPDIPAQIADHRREHYEQWPVRSNRASLLGHPCLRHLVYQRTRWRDAAMPHPTLLSIFEEGHVHEAAAIRQLQKAGFRVILQQRALEYPEHEITGTIDGCLLLNGDAVPFDIKSTSSGTWRSLETVEDLRTHPAYYVRAWFDQMQLYMLLHEKPQAIILLKDKTTGLLRQLVLDLDYAYCERLIQKADQINAHVREGTVPDRMPYDERICGDCSFFSICLPDEALRTGAVLLDNPDLAGKLQRRADLEAAAKEFARLDDDIKKQAKLALDPDGEAVVGIEWVIQRKDSERRGYEVKGGTVTTIKIQRLGKANGEGREEVA